MVRKFNVIRIATTILVLTTAGLILAGCAGQDQGTRSSTITADRPSSAPSKPSSAHKLPPRRIGVTIYSSADAAAFDPQAYLDGRQQWRTSEDVNRHIPGFGVIRDTRPLSLARGLNTVRFSDFARYIDPTSVSLVDLSAIAEGWPARGVQVVAQKFAFDLVSPQKLLEQYIGRDITLNQHPGDGQNRPVTGKLLSSTPEKIVFQTTHGVRIFDQGDDIQLGPLPDGLITRPTLVWTLRSARARCALVRTAYQTDAMTWHADYKLMLNQNVTQASLAAWVTVLNLSGAAYPNAKLKLMAGDVQHVGATRWNGVPPLRHFGVSYFGGNETPKFEEQPFFEYHMYTLNQRVDIQKNTTQQLVLFPTVRGIHVKEKLVYEALPQASEWYDKNKRSANEYDINQEVDVYVEFANRQENHLGIPLPKGKVRVYLQHPEGSGRGPLEFIGEDLIDHTAKNANVLVKVGQSFDLAGSRVADWPLNYGGMDTTATVHITLGNAGKKPRQVTIKESLFRLPNWKIISHSDPFEKIDSRTIHFVVTVPANGTKAVEYKAKYTR